MGYRAKGDVGRCMENVGRGYGTQDRGGRTPHGGTPVGNWHVGVQWERGRRKWQGGGKGEAKRVVKNGGKAGKQRRVSYCSTSFFRLL
jgi:hypothetical protein